MHACRYISEKGGDIWVVFNSEVIFPHLSDDIPFDFFVICYVLIATFISFQVVHAVTYNFFPLRSICC